MTKAAAQEKIGARIARLRRDKDLTQTELAQALGVSQPVVSDYENDVIGRLPKRDQEALARTIDAFLSKAS